MLMPNRNIFAKLQPLFKKCSAAWGKIEPRIAPLLTLGAVLSLLNALREFQLIIDLLKFIGHISQDIPVVREIVLFVYMMGGLVLDHFSEFIEFAFGWAANLAIPISPSFMSMISLSISRSASRYFKVRSVVAKQHDELEKANREQQEKTRSESKLLAGIGRQYGTLSEHSRIETLAANPHIIKKLEDQIRESRQKLRGVIKVGLRTLAVFVGTFLLLYLADFAYLRFLK
jgi:hypothetical protein